MRGVAAAQDSAVVEAQLGQWAEEGHIQRHLHRANSDEGGLQYFAAASLAGLAGAQDLIKEAAVGSDLARLEGEMKTE